MEDFTQPDPAVEGYKAEIENAMLVAALKGAGAGNGETRKDIYSRWLHGTFLAATHGLERLDAGILDWQRDGDGFRLVWISATGMACPLGRIYLQADGTYAALVVAGVKRELPEAMAAVEWAVSRLSS